ncbi:hypothetical protein [Streptomyces sp. NPDC002540]
MLTRSRSEGTRFLAGLFAGEVIAATLMSPVVYVIGAGLAVLVPHTGLQVVMAAVAVILGVADLLNRTPHIWRQVPQSLVRTHPPGMLGLSWGFDLALLFTTQKTTSLTWAALAAALLLHPSFSWLYLVGMAVVGVLTIALRSITWNFVPLSEFGDRLQPWFVPTRRAAGALLVVVGVLTAAGAW